MKGYLSSFLFQTVMLIENFYSVSYSVKEPFVYLNRENFTDDMNVNRVIQINKGDIDTSFNYRDLISDIESQNLFLDLFYNDKDKCVKNIAFPNLSKNSLVKFYIDNNINFQVSKIVCKKQYDKDVIIALLLDSTDKGEYDLRYTSNYNVKINPLQDGTYKLSEFHSDLLSKIRVKKIITDIPNCYLTLKADNRRVCNNIPSSLLRLDFKNEEVFFNNYQINIFESYLTLNESTDKEYNLTFFY